MKLINASRRITLYESKQVSVLLLSFKKKNLIAVDLKYR